MKALTIRQPWAWLIMEGHKDVECRCWETKFRGRFAVHAAAAMARGWREICENVEAQTDIRFPEEVPIGSIVGTVELVDCVRQHNSIWACDDGWNWILRNPIKCRPVPFQGKLKFFDFEGKLTPIKTSK